MKTFKKKLYDVNRRNLLKTALALGVGYGIGRTFPNNHDKDTLLINSMVNQSFKNILPESFYAHNLLYHVNFPQISSNDECDICIIGGGLTGISTALNLMHQKKKVILLEADTIASHASGLNGGQVQSSYECGMNFFEEKFNDTITKKFWDLSIDAINIVKNNIQKYKLNCGWQQGIGIVAYKKEHYETLKTEYDIIHNKFNYPHIQLFDAKQTYDLLGSNVYYGLLYDSASGHLNPLNYTKGLAYHLKNHASNIKIFENSKATNIAFNNDNHIINVNNMYTIKAKKIILTANYANKELFHELASAIIPIDTFMMATEPLPKNLVNTIIKNRTAIYDTRHVMNYYRLTETNCLLFGGGDSIGKFDPHTVQKALYKEMIYIFPQLAGINIKYFWYGKDSFTVNLAPSIGRRMNDSVYFAQGYSGQGVALSNLMGKIFADAINGNDTNLKLFEQIKHLNLIDSKIFKDLSAQIGMTYFKFLDAYK